jgi:hypothetical protein
MVANANSWLSASRNLNKNTEAVAAAIWAQVQNNYYGKKNANLSKLKRVKNLINAGYYNNTAVQQAQQAKINATASAKAEINARQAARNAQNAAAAAQKIVASAIASVIKKQAAPASTSQPAAGNQTIRNKLFEKGQSFNFWGMHGPSLNGPLKNILSRTKNKTKRFQLGFGPKTITPSNAQYQALKTKNAKGRYYGNLAFWENPGLPDQIEFSNLPELQKNALRRMIRSVKLNKEYPRQTRNSSGNRMKLTNDLMNIKNNKALVKKIAERGGPQAKLTDRWRTPRGAK